MDTIRMWEEWMSIVGPNTSCKYIHPGMGCGEAVLSKTLKVGQACFKLYAVLHGFHLLLRLAKKKHPVRVELWSRLCNFIGSVGFMMVMVGGLKLSLCLNNGFHGNNDGWFLVKAAFPSSLCLFLEDPFRRRQITYFIVVRALRSLYVLLKRRSDYFSCFRSEGNISFIILFGFFAYIYYNLPEWLPKEKTSLDAIWGEA